MKPIGAVLARQPLVSRETLDYCSACSRRYGKRCSVARSLGRRQGRDCERLSDWLVLPVFPSMLLAIYTTHQRSRYAIPPPRHAKSPLVVECSSPALDAPADCPSALSPGCRTNYSTHFKRTSRAYADRSRKLHCRSARIRSVRYPSGPLLAGKDLGGLASPPQGLHLLGGPMITDISDI